MVQVVALSSAGSASRRLSREAVLPSTGIAEEIDNAEQGVDCTGKAQWLNAAVDDSG
jgi:hypothetical protein